MKTLAILLLASNVFASCPAEGWVEWPEHSGHCASLAAPKEADVPEVQPSKDKPPRDKMPSWEREGVVAAMPDTLIARDKKEDDDRAVASIKGKLKAKVPLSPDEKMFLESRAELFQ